MLNSTIYSINSTVKLLHDEVGGAELQKQELGAVVNTPIKNAVGEYKDIENEFYSNDFLNGD